MTQKPPKRGRPNRFGKGVKTTTSAIRYPAIYKTEVDAILRKLADGLENRIKTQNHD